MASKGVQTVSESRCMGIVCAKDGFSWQVVSGTSRSDAQTVDWKKVKAPSAERGNELVWLREELFELVESQNPARVGFRVTDPGGNPSVGKVEVEGVICEGVTAASVELTRIFSATLSNFKARNKSAVTEAALLFTCIRDTPKSRRDPAVAALMLLEQ